MYQSPFWVLSQLFAAQLGVESPSMQSTLILDKSAEHYDNRQTFHDYELDSMTISTGSSIG
jgi:hypothetical protein